MPWSLGSCLDFKAPHTARKHFCNECLAKAQEIHGVVSCIFFSVCLLKFSAKIIYSSANSCVSDMWLFSLSFYSHSASQL